MKRETKKRYQDLNSFFPLLFWYTCTKCKKEFRREKGWRGLTGPWLSGVGQWRYLCRECAPTREDADNFFLNDRWMIPPPTKRPAPPPPPIPRIKKIVCSPELFDLSTIKEKKSSNTKRIELHEKLNEAFSIIFKICLLLDLEKTYKSLLTT